MTTDAGGPDNPFDALAGVWDDDPEKLERARVVAAAIRARTTGGGVWLDYGAGTGALGLALLGHADAVVLADSSAGMVQAARAKVDASGLGERVEVVELDLSRDADLQGEYDAVVSLLALHHIDQVDEVVKRLTAMLRPGGWLALSDLDAEDGSFHGHHHGVRPAHHGFSRDQLRAWLNQAGLVDIDVSTPWVNVKEGRDYPLFLAVGRKPSH